MVYLIGAGPGDPGLFTFKGKSILESADVVVYDRLVSPSILAFCREDAQMVDVGKMPTHHKVKQSEINKLLVKFAKELPGKNIVRLKGGDPFVFGRGGEEALELVSAGIDFEVVPGVTSAIAVPAYAGIPVSHRGIATSFLVITGHEKQGERDSFSTVPGLDFETLAKCPGTLIFLMGIANMGYISRRLIECGKDPKTPLAFIEKGTTPFQRTVMATLETAEETIAKEKVTHPAIIIMGDVVELGKTLAWKKHLPLSGKRLILTRSSNQNSEIASKLRALGAEVIEIRAVETHTLEAPKLILPRQAENADIQDLKNFDILAFTSVNGIDSFWELLRKFHFDIRSLAGKQFAAISEKKLLESGIFCDIVPEDHTINGLGKLLSQKTGKRILHIQGIPESDVLSKSIPNLTRWAVYETLPAKEMKDWKRETIACADAIVFTSSSGVSAFSSMVKPIEETPKLAFSLGRITTAAAQAKGFDVHQSDVSHADSLVQKIVEHFSK